MTRIFCSISPPTTRDGHPGHYINWTLPRSAARCSVYAKLPIGYERVEEIDRVLDDVGLAFTEIPRSALFLAGRVFQRYRAKGGSRSGVLPDFFIGAHGAVSQFPLLTRDSRRYRTYFPGITLIVPDQAEPAAG